MVYLIGRHYVFNEETLEELQNIVDNTNAAADLVSKNKYPIELGLKLTVNEEQVGPVITKKAKDTLEKLPAKTWLLYDPVNRGAGTSYRQILFNPTFADQDGIVISADFDQFIIDNPEGLESILSLVEDIKRKNALYGIGSRDVPVVLAKHQRNSNLRIIHELFHSLAVGNKMIVAQKDPRATPTPAYAALGESTTGLYVMNQGHCAYPKLLESINTAVQQANMQGFATDYYVAMKAPLLAPMATGYVKARENQSYHQKTEQEEYQGIIKLISSQTAELTKTDISTYLAEALILPDRGEKISQFYDKKDVAEVQQLMIQAYKR